MNDWVITLPMRYDWQQYLDEIAQAAREGLSSMYRVSRMPREMQPGDRCFVVHRGRVRGWMRVVDVVQEGREWICETTGQRWPPGNYICRGGAFHEVAHGPEMRGFRGVRRYHVVVV